MPTTATTAQKTAENPPSALGGGGRPQTFSGVVVSNKMKDTVVVVIERYIKHAKYHKFQTKKSRIAAHDEGNTKKIGDKATIQACRPLSKTKAFKVIA